MIEIVVPKDIREYEPTLIGPLTTRKAVCLVVMCAFVYGVYLLEKAFGIEDPLEMPIFLFFGIPPFLVGWYKPFGMHLEKFLGKAFRDNFIAPQNRPYKIENMWDTILAEEKKKNTVNRKTPEKKETRETPRTKLPEELKAYR